MIRKLGRFVEFSVFGAPTTVDWSIIGDRKELDILGSHLSPYCFPFVIENIASGNLKTSGVVTRQFPIEQWDTIIAINLTSSFHTVRATVPGMKKRKWGRIINICSAHSLRASPFKSAYVSAKHGLAGFTKTVALELAEHGVTANAISPGFVWTPLVEKQIPDLAKSENITLEQAKKQVLSRQPTNQFVTVEQVAALAAFLASEAAASITGANYSIDGGWTAQ